MKGKLTQQSILLFERKGFSETSIQDIVESLGVTKGTFYYYFNSKEQLLMAIHLGYIDDLLQRQEEILKQNVASRKKVEQMIGLLINDIEQYGPSGRVFFREMRHLTDENADEVKGKREQFRKNIELLIRDGMIGQEFRQDLQPGIVAFTILGVTNWSYQWFNPAGEISAEDLSGIYSDVILNGIT